MLECKPVSPIMHHITGTLLRPAAFLCCFFAFVSFTSCQSVTRAEAPSGVSTEPIAPANAPFPMPQFLRPSFPPLRFDIQKFGAQSGGTFKCTHAIQSAID